MALAESHDLTRAPRRVTILGSTGSVGCSTVDLLRRNRDAYDVEALTAFSNVTLLAKQARELRARIAVIGDPALYGALREALAGTNIAAAAGPAALIEAAARPSDWVMAAIVGAAGLAPTLAAARRGAILAIANKECLVTAGPVFRAEMERGGATLLPVDSEHNAIFQVFDFDQPETVDRLILTASGGPFLDADAETLARVTPAQAVAHPNWRMGAKISVDSATMMNKGLELIEAAYIFDMPSERIEVLIHPQSVVHSLVAYVDGSVLAQLGTPDMRTPIAYALGWPRRIPAPARRLDLAALGQLTFQAPDLKRFPALTLAREALQSGGAAPTLLNAANEVAVHAFLSGQISFLDIVRVVENALVQAPRGTMRALDDVLAVDAEARQRAQAFIVEL